MSELQRPLFVVGSGRCGTYTVYKILEQVPWLTPQENLFHEYKCEGVQQLGWLYHQGLISTEQAAKKLVQIYPKNRPFVDVSNKCSWLIEPLKLAFYDAQWIWLHRDGRQVCLSYYHKLKEEHYTEDGIKRSLDYRLNYFRGAAIPPLEKQYWWPLPPFETIDDFAGDRWQYVCWHWGEVNRQIYRGLRGSRYGLIPISKISERLKTLMLSVGYTPTDTSSQAMRNIARIPTNVHQPRQYQMTKKQLLNYKDECCNMHERLGYDWKELPKMEYLNNE